MEKKVLVLSGCPASGKSSFVARLKERERLRVLSFDDLLEQVTFSPENYHLARKQLVKEAEDWIGQNQECCLVVEDTNHLRSLVKPFRVLCKAYGLPFMHLVLVVDLDTALERNCKREVKVSEETLSKIFTQISSENFFRETVFWNSEKGDFEEILGSLRNAKVLTVEKQKIKTDLGFKHLLDLKLRKQIKTLVSQYDGNRGEYAAGLTREKTKILKPLKKIDFQEYLEFLQSSLIILNRLL